MPDAATVAMELTEEVSTGEAALLHRAGSRAVSHLCAPGPDDVAAVARRLAAAGYRTKRLTGPETTRFLKLRGDYSGRLDALAAHLGAERTLLIPA